MPNHDKEHVILGPQIVQMETRNQQSHTFLDTDRIVRNATLENTAVRNSVTS